MWSTVRTKCRKVTGNSEGPGLKREKKSTLFLYVTFKSPVLND